MTPPSHRAASMYRNVGVETRAPQSDPYQLVALSYEVLLDRITAARGAMVAGNIEQKIKLIDKAIRIIQEGLRTSLDMENGGDIAANLAALYEYAVTRLTQANATNNPAMLEEVADLIKPLADAWKHIRPGQKLPTEVPAATQAIQVPNIAASAMGTARPSVMGRMMGGMYGLGMAGV